MTPAKNGKMRRACPWHHIPGRTMLLLLPSVLVPAGGRITPTPQQYADTTLGLDGRPAEIDLAGWTIAASASVGALPLTQLLNATAGRRAGGVQALPQRHAIALGVPSEDAALAALAAAHGVSLHPAATVEGRAPEFGVGRIGFPPPGKE